jgi:hypothetical protein
MWRELIWNIEFARNFISVVIGILVASFIIPWILKQRDKRLAKDLIRQWGNACMNAILVLKPDTEAEQKQRSELFEKGDWELKKYVSADQIINDIWENIEKGKEEPDGSAKIIMNVLEKVLYSDEERNKKGLPSEKKYTFPSNQADLIRLWVRRILNPMYAKIEIFDLELLPIGELELVMINLDRFSKQGHFSRHEFVSFAFHLALSMEKFGEYLWKLENLSNKLRKGCRKLFKRMLRREGK